MVKTLDLKKSLKKIVNLNKNAEIINLYLEDIAKNKDIILREVKNISYSMKKK